MNACIQKIHPESSEPPSTFTDEKSDQRKGMNEFFHFRAKPIIVPLGPKTGNGKSGEKK